MSAELIYKTTSPAAIEWYRRGSALLTEQHDARAAFENELLDTFGPSTRPRYGKDAETPRRALWISESGVIGIDCGYNEKPPVDSGLRLDSREHIWKPALRSYNGREWATRFADLTLWVPRQHYPEIGIPSLAIAGHSMYRGGIEFDEDPEPTLYQTWGSGQCESECLAAAKAAPEVVWVEVPRSAWYARLEAKEAAA